MDEYFKAGCIDGVKPDDAMVGGWMMENWVDIDDTNDDVKLGGYR